MKENEYDQQNPSYIFLIFYVLLCNALTLCFYDLLCTFFLLVSLFIFHHLAMLAILSDKHLLSILQNVRIIQNLQLKLVFLLQSSKEERKKYFFTTFVRFFNYYAFTDLFWSAKKWALKEGMRTMYHCVLLYSQKFKRKMKGRHE